MGERGLKTCVRRTTKTLVAKHDVKEVHHFFLCHLFVFHIGVVDFSLILLLILLLFAYDSSVGHHFSFCDLRDHSFVPSFNYNLLVLYCSAGMLLLFVSFVLLPLCWSFSDDTLRKELFDIQTSINNYKDIIKPVGDQMEPASSIYLTHHWKNFTGDKPIMVCMWVWVCRCVSVIYIYFYSNLTSSALSFLNPVVDKMHVTLDWNNELSFSTIWKFNWELF